MGSIKGEKQQAIKGGKLPFKQELIRLCPQGKEFPKPHTGQSYHSTSNTLNPITVSHTRPVSLPNTHTHTHIHTQIQILDTHKQARTNFVFYSLSLSVHLTLFLSLIRGHNHIHRHNRIKSKPSLAPKPHVPFQ